jgi:hypothetical protein
MACAEDACWQCGAPWASEAAGATRLRVIAGGANETTDDTERWVDEGGSIRFEGAGAQRAHHEQEMTRCTS